MSAPRALAASLLAAVCAVPAAILAQYEGQVDVNAIVNDKDTEAQLEKIGFMPVGGSVKEANAYVQSETGRWGDIIRRVGLEPK